MSTNTTRLALVKATGPENYSVTIVNGNLDKVDAAIGASPCTSGARPATSLFDGRLAYESDTDAVIEYKASDPGWRYVTPPNVATQTARNALSPKYDGLRCYRQDRDWFETYDSSFWRVEGIAKCASVADRDGASGITSPYAGQYAVTNDTRTLWIYTGSAWVTEFEKLLTSFGSSATVATDETTTSSSYTDLATAGPSVTLTSSGTRALIWFGAHGSNNTANCASLATVAVSGATTLAAADANGALWGEYTTANLSSEMSQFMVVTITPGSNTYTLKYKRGGSGGTALFGRRRIYVLAP